MSSLLTYLALGDSYTIGEQVPIYENFPYQLVQLLRKEGKHFAAPEIVAKTGWTTDELQAGINSTSLLPSYDLVTLLIGVNNQYRGRKLDEFEKDFRLLVEQVVRFAGNPSHVFVLSIPDWGVTPFAEGRDRQEIALQIDAFNAIKKTYAEKSAVNFINITQLTREAAADNSLLATDGLHPSGKDYSRWAHLVYNVCLNIY